VNRIQYAALTGQGSNMMSLITDCDQRDERLGAFVSAAVVRCAVTVINDWCADCAGWMGKTRSEFGCASMIGCRDGCCTCGIPGDAGLTSNSFAINYDISAFLVSVCPASVACCRQSF
jgi:hypothetical protein